MTTSKLDQEALLKLLQPPLAEQGGGAVVRKPQIESDSVFDSMMERLAKKAQRWLGGDDAASQVMGIAGAMDVPGGAAGPAAKAVEAVKNSPAGKALGELLKKIPNPIRAYHGSPHDFEQFDASKIGTGEGAQAFGHGLYFADSPEVAQAYRSQLSKGGNTGRTYEVNIHASPDAMLDWDAPLHRQGAEASKALAPIVDYLRSKPLNPEVMKKLTDGTATGRELYLWLSGERSLDAARKTWPKIVGRPDVHATEALKEAGIPGIKYKDRLSRKVASSGEPTLNYSINDAKLIEIVRKYGIAGAVSAGLINEAQAQQMQKQGYK